MVKILNPPKGITFGKKNNLVWFVLDTTQPNAGVPIASIPIGKFPFALHISWQNLQNFNTTNHFHSLLSSFHGGYQKSDIMKENHHVQYVDSLEIAQVKWPEAHSHSGDFRHFTPNLSRDAFPKGIQRNPGPDGRPTSDIFTPKWCVIKPSAAPGIEKSHSSMDVVFFWKNQRNPPWSSSENRWFPVSIFPSTNPLNRTFVVFGMMWATQHHKSTIWNGLYKLWVIFRMVKKKHGFTTWYLMWDGMTLPGNGVYPQNKHCDREHDD